VLVDHRPGSVFRWLQAIEFPDLAFVVIDPLAFVPDYPVENVRKAIAFCELEPDEEVAVLAICTVPPAPEEPTANFLAPLGIGLRSRRGAQIVLHDCGFDTRVPFLRKP
jgi:flagellar assembly factor FliW